MSVVDLTDDFGEDWDDEVINELAQTEASLPEATVASTNVDFQDSPNAEHLSALHRLFGHKKFRPMQWQIIGSILNQKRDNCAIMSTGYGKSLCFQYPSAFCGGVTFVISPLISLMEDQVLALTVANIPACLLGTANSKKEQTYNEIRENKYRLVYLTPEFCSSDHGMELLQEWSKTLRVTLIAIDEAHCVSSWGHDFRAQYRKLGLLRVLMPNVPILAVTATATDVVKKDIIENLKLRNPQLCCTSVDRPNFYFAVNKKSNLPAHDFEKVMVRCDTGWKFSGPTIVYCIARKTTEFISDLLKAKGINCAPYHAGFSLTTRKETHEKFVKDEIDVIVATIAFGMGIDKPDIRNVIHYGVSDSIEAYYQEVGRAGRDGQPANCISFYESNDFQTRRFLINKSCKNVKNMERAQSKLLAVQDYLETDNCRRQFILNYFNEKMDTSNRDNCCDNCQNSAHQKPNADIYTELDQNGKYNFSADARLLLTAISTINRSFGLMTYVHFLRGSREKKMKAYIGMPLHGAGKCKLEIWWKELGEMLIKKKLLIRKGSGYGKFVSMIEMTGGGREFLMDTKKELIEDPTKEMLRCLKTKGNIWQSKDSDIPSGSLPSTSTSYFMSNETSGEVNEILTLYRLLINKRGIMAAKENCMPYMIATNNALMQMAKLNPKTLKEMDEMNFDGFTAVKLEKFGKQFLDLIVSNQKIISIEDRLKESPLPEATKITPTVDMSYTLFKSGKSIQEIAKERGFAESTIQSHLSTCLKNGFEIKLSDFGVTKSVAEIVIEAIFQANSGLTLLTPVKLACPDEISYGQIKAVMAHLEIREHLTMNNLEYEEFDNPEYYEMYKKYQKVQVVEMDKLDELLTGLQEANNLDIEDEISTFSDELLANACDDLEKSLTDHSDDTIILEPVTKKSKIDFSKLLDSPPEPDILIKLNRNNSKKIVSSQHVDTTNVISETGESNSDKNLTLKTDQREEKKTSQTSFAVIPKKKDDVKLPPWLSKKRVA